MVLNVAPMLREATDRSLERNGLILIGILFVLSLLSGLLGAGRALWTEHERRMA